MHGYGIRNQSSKLSNLVFVRVESTSNCSLEV